MKKLNEKYRGKDFDNYRGSYSRFEMVNHYFLKVVKNAIGSDITQKPSRIEEWGEFSFSGENGEDYIITVVAPDFYEILKDDGNVKVWRGAGEEEFLDDLRDALDFSRKNAMREAARTFSKKDMQELIENLTGSRAIKLRSSFKDGKLTMKGTLETGKGYSSNHSTKSGSYHVVNGELAVNAGKYYNSSRGVYMTNWKYTGIKLPIAMKNDVKDVEYKFEQDLD